MLTRRTTTERSLSPLFSLRDDFDRWLDGFARRMNHPSLLADTDEAEYSFYPVLDVVEGEKELTVTAELPGVDEKDLEIELTTSALILHGKKESEEKEEGDNYFRQERRFGAFWQSVALPWEVDTSKVKAEAKFKKGVLTVKVPKPETAVVTRRKVEVAAS